MSVCSFVNICGLHMHKLAHKNVSEKLTFAGCCTVDEGAGAYFWV